MTMKFLYVGDPHNQVRTPTNRTDKFHETYDNKVQEIKELAVKHKVKAILQPGDFLNSPNYNNDFLMDVVEKWSVVPGKYEMLKKMSYQGENLDDYMPDFLEKLKKDIPIVGIIGNHELIGNSLNSYSKTSLAFLERLGFMHMVTKDEPMIFEDDGVTVSISGTHYHSNIDTPDYVDDYIVDDPQGDYNIHMVHGMLKEKSLGSLIKHTTVDAIKETEADLTIAGHDHIGFDLIEEDGKKFVNPGAMTRTKSDLKEIKRKPKVLLITIDGTADEPVKVEDIYLKSAPDGEKVLDRQSIVAKQKQQGKVSKIESIVNKAKLSKGQTIKDVISSVSEAQGIDKEVTSEVEDRITEKIKTMDGNTGTNAQPYKLTQIVLENFQSHKKSIFTVDEHLNVLTGESSNGKTAIMRAMRWLLDGHGTSVRDTYIRHGASQAKVTAVFDNGMMVSKVIDRSKKSNAKNGWEIYDPVTGETEYGNTDLVEKVREHFGYTKIKYGSKNSDEMDINFLNQGDGWYFIGHDVSSPDRGRIIGSIFGTHYAEAVIKEYNADMREKVSERKLREQDKTEVSEKLKDFSHLSTIENKLKKANTLLAQLEEIQEKHQDIMKLLNKRNELEQRIEKCKKFISSIDDQKMEELVNRFEELFSKYNDIKNLVNRKNKVLQSGKKARRIVDALSNFDKYEEKVDVLDNKVKLYNELSNLNKQYIIVEKSMETHKRTIKQAIENMKKSEKEYVEILSDAGTCPTCGQETDEKHIHLEGVR